MRTIAEWFQVAGMILASTLRGMGLGAVSVLTLVSVANQLFYAPVTLTLRVGLILAALGSAVVTTLVAWLSRGKVRWANLFSLLLALGCWYSPWLLISNRPGMGELGTSLGFVYLTLYAVIIYTPVAKVLWGNSSAVTNTGD